jgi:pyruvate formate lyase activating enzyme
MAEMIAEELKEGKVRCRACNHYCMIEEGHAGYCGVRANENGKLRLIVYGRPCAAWADPIEKKPLFHFLPGSLSYSIGTLGCNFSCEFCQNYDISQAPQEARKKDPGGWREYFERMVKGYQEMPPAKVVENAISSGCKSIAFTYNEPTIFSEYAIDIMDAGRDKGLKSVYVTNGYESPECWDALSGKLDAANIDLKAFTNKFYQKLCKVELEPVLESIKTASRMGIHIEITTLIIPGWNDGDDELQSIAKFLRDIDPDMPWHVTAFSPHYKMKDTPPTEPETLLRAKAIGLEEGLRHVYVGNVPMSYQDHESTHCPSCSKIVLKRSGFALVENNLIDGKCRFCKEKIKGVWK